MLRSTALFIGLAIGGSALAAEPAFNLESPDIKAKAKIADEQVFNGFGCSGKNISPVLKWSGAPKGARQVNTDFGGPGWGGPCPPAGDKPHRYNFTLHALKVEKLEIPASATASLAGFMVNANSIGKATLTGTYGRPKK